MQLRTKATILLWTTIAAIVGGLYYLAIPPATGGRSALAAQLQGETSLAAWFIFLGIGGLVLIWLISEVLLMQDWWTKSLGWFMAGLLTYGLFGEAAKLIGHFLRFL